ncbi:MAG: NAD(P)-binding protein [Gemmatimonadetes bacterium]|nr:NAD(P)-binding protein [Gemmatimonadota bacterium]
MAESPKQKIAILGGGVGAMTAAYAITESPGWEDKYDITLYQMGWRNGGKGASGRNQEMGDRIEEHGLHIWFGFYENAFSAMKSAYAECKAKGLSPGSPFDSYLDAFKPHNTMTAMEEFDGEWQQWPFEFPYIKGEYPGDGGSLLTEWEHLKKLVEWIIKHLEDWHQTDPSFKKGLLVKTMEVALLAELGRLLGGKKVVAGPGTHLDHVKHLVDAMPADVADHDPVHHSLLDGLLQKFLDLFMKVVEHELEKNASVRHIYILLDTAIAAVRGILNDGVLQHGYGILDQWDAREWLKRNGASELSLESPLLHGYYDLAFAYEHGDTDTPNFAAGVFTRSFLRVLFEYRGAIVWKMQAGMGDTVFSPLYLVLKERGVKFEFFHRVTNLGLSADQKSVETVEMDVQATVKAGPDGYDPLIPVGGIPCWPSEPLYDQLVEGDQLKRDGVNLETAWCPFTVGKKTLVRKLDFDVVLLGISLAGVEHVAGELIAVNDKWKAMVSNVKTTQTQAFQLWMTKDTAELGWESKELPVSGAFVEPFDTWADMSQLIRRETWPKSMNVENVSYFCGPFKDAPEIPPFTDCKFPEKQRDRVKAAAVKHLTQNMHWMWPKVAGANSPGGFDWNILLDHSGANGTGRFDTQYWRANIDPSERYVLSVKGSTQFRLKGGESGFDNLVLAGDWTDNTLCVGCVEAATISGLQASRAVCGHPEHIHGE